MQLNRPDLLINECLVNGEWINHNEKITVTNPANQTVIGTVPSLDVSQTNQAITAAKKAHASWSNTTAKHRANALQKWFQLILQHSDDLATILTYEQGKPLTEAKGEILYAAAYIEWFAEESRRTYGDIIPANTANKTLLVTQKSIGVVAAITPWNFPIAMITRKAAAAMAAGCTVIIKPASETPFSALAATKLAIEAGIPDGVIQVVTGKSDVVAKTLIEDTRVRKLSFTGSTAVGQTIMQQSAHTMKRLSMELGGNAPFIVFEDADIKLAVQHAILAKFRNAGQTCVCANRIYVHDRVYNEFISEFTHATAQLKLGFGWEEGINVGPLINEKAIQNCFRLIEDALKNGAKLELGGHTADTIGKLFFYPTVLSDVPNSALVMQEEIFGPIAPICRFHEESDVVEMANDTPYGLAAYVFTQCHKRILTIGAKLQFGMVGINEGIVSTEVAPFGGVKYSGFGREGSKYGLDDYLDKQYICINHG